MNNTAYAINAQEFVVIQAINHLDEAKTKIKKASNLFTLFDLSYVLLLI